MTQVKGSYVKLYSFEFLKLPKFQMDKLQFEIVTSIFKNRVVHNVHLRKCLSNVFVVTRVEES